MIKKTILLLSSALLLSACSYGYGTTPPSPSQAPSAPAAQNQGSGSLTISNFAFSPSSQIVKAGQSISVTNNDSVPHTVTSDDGTSFNTNTINPGTTATFTAPEKAGTYTFHCNIHKTMTGTLIVQ